PVPLVVGDCVTAGLLRQTLGVAGPDAGAPTVVVLVGHYVLEPADHGEWLSRDVPHLPIVIGDTGAVVGPFVEPGVGPCLHCLQLHRTDTDAAWPAIAAQLWGRRSAAETPGFAAELASIAHRVLRERHEGGPSVTAS